MKVEHIIADAFKSDVLLYVKGNDLAFKTKKGTLPDHIRKNLQENKSDIIQYLINNQMDKSDYSKETLAPIPHQAINEARLSYAQQRLWFIAQLDNGNAAYHLSAGLRLHGKLSIPALEKTFHTIVERHDSLRTMFKEVDGEAVQIVTPHATFSLVYRDLSDLLRKAQTPALEKETELESSKPFDLSKGPLFRGRLLKINDNEHILLMTMHHIISDAWSMSVLVDEINTLYRHYSHDTKSNQNPLTPLSIQYTDYAVWQRESVTTEMIETSENYWLSHLQNAPALINLPTSWERPPIQSYRGDNHEFMISPDVYQKIQAFTHSKGLTSHMFFYSAWVILLSRLSGDEHIVVGTPVANRGRQELESLIGFFVNTLALHIDVTDNPSVNQLLEKVKETTLAAYNHQQVPFERIVELTNPERSMSHSPIFQTIFDFSQEAKGGALDLPGLRIEGIETKSTIAQFDLSMSLAGNEDGVAGSLEFATDLFDKETIQRWSEYFIRIVNAMITDSDTSINSLNLVSDAERHYLLETLNQTEMHDIEHESIHQQFESQVISSPEAIAVEHGSDTITYKELNQRANQLAHYLRQQGTQTSELIGIYLPRSIDFLTAMLGILKAGAAYVVMDVNNPEQRLLHIQESADLRTIISHEQLASLFPSTALCLDSHICKESLAVQPGSNLAIALTQNSPAFAYFTSGSTGIPKGALNSHYGVVNNMLAMATKLSLTSSDRVLQFASLGFDVVIEEIFPTWFAGATIVLRDQEGLLSVVQFQQLLIDKKISICELMAAYWGHWVEYLHGQGTHPPITLRMIMLGSDRVPMSVYAKWQGFDIPTLNVFGLTETACTSLVYHAQGAQFHEQYLPNGKPLANTQVYVLDRYLQPVPEGVTGELYIGGVGVGLGYVGQVEMSAKHFIDNPYADGKLYKTGDAARWLSNGNMEFIGRRDNQVKVRGFRIELGEIETQLEQIAEIEDAAVTLCKEKGNQQLVAWVTTANKQPLDVEHVRQSLKHNLPDYMLPHAIIELSTLPLTVSGKVNYAALPVPDLGDLQEAYRAPEGDIEKTIATIWQELLTLDQVGRDDHFFTIGGHSLLVIQLIAKLQSADFRVDVRDVFEAPILQDLAKRIKKESALTFIAPANLIPQNCDLITPAMLPLVSLEQQQIVNLADKIPGGMLNIQDIYPLAPLQEGILFHHMLSSVTEGDTYIMPTLLSIANRDELDNFIAALNKVIARHDVLRTAVFWEGLPIAVQVVLKHAELDVQTINLDPAIEAITQLREAIEPEKLWINLSTAPLLQIKVAQDPHSEKYFIIINEHHIINDHIGLEVLLEELEVYLYNENPELPATVPYREFVAHTLALTNDEKIKTYFSSRLSDIDETTAPFGIHSTQVLASQINESVLAVDAALASTLRQLSEDKQITTASIFHLAWALVIGRCSDRDDVVFGTTVSGRLQGTRGADRMLGLFINTLPLRIPLTGTVIDSLLFIQDEIFELLNYEQVPLATALSCAQLPNDTPLFTSLFNYRYARTLANANTNDENRADTIVDLGAPNDRGNYPFDLSVDDQGEDGFTLIAQVEASIDPKKITGYVHRALERIVYALEQEPHQALRDVSILPAHEVTKLLKSNNTETQTTISPLFIHQQFEIQAANHALAIAAEHKEEKITYEALNNRANQLAHYLIEQGIRDEELVGIHLPRSIDFLIAMLAIMKAGATYVILDVNNPAERLQQITHQATLSTILTHSELTQPFFEQSLHLNEGDLQSTLAKHSVANVDISISEQAPAFAYFTSGSTGTPKGALNSHAGVVNNMRAMVHELQLTSNDRVLQFASLGFDVVIEEIFPTWFAGATVVLRDEEGLLDPAQLQALLTRQNISVCELMASYWAHWVEYLKRQDISPPENLRLLMLGSDRVAMKVYQQWQAFDIPIVNVFGLTETGCTSLVYHASGPQPYTDYLPNGQAIANTQVYVLDKQAKPVPQGVIGELYIGGAGVGLGYINDPALSETHFVQHSLIDGYLYKTGDAARWLADGQLEFIGRRDRQVKIRGFRIELGEIEAQLRKLNNVSDAAVSTDHQTGSGVRIIAWVTSTDNDKLTLESTTQELTSYLPEHMLPHAIITLDSMPLTVSGKINYAALPTPDSKDLQTTYVAPLGSTEKSLAAIWQQMLDIDSIGRDDNFFSLGGHSLLVIQLLAKLQEVDLHTNVKAVFANPRLKELAASIDSSHQTSFKAPPNIIPVDCQYITPELLPLINLQQEHIDLIATQIPGGMENIQDIYPLAPLQEGILFHHMMSTPEQGDTYIMPTLLIVANNHELDKLLHALNATVARHDVLRTAILWKNLPCALQVVLRETTLAVNHVELDANIDSLTQMRERIKAENLWIDLTQAPLLQVEVAADPHSEKYFVIVNEQHIINDHIGLEVLMQELDTYYADDAPQLLPSVPYREFVAHTLALADSGDMKNYFDTRLGDLDEPILPFGISHTQVEPSQIIEAELSVDDHTTYKIRHHCQQLGITAASFFHLAWAIVVGRCSDHDDVVFGTVLSGRLQGTEGATTTLGLFINTLPIRVDISDSLSSSLTRTHHELLNLLTYEQASLGFVRSCTSLSNDAPLFTSLLNYRRDNVTTDKINNITPKGLATEAQKESHIMELNEGRERTNYPITMAVDDKNEQGFELVAQVINTLDPDEIVGYLYATIKSMINALDSQTEHALSSMDIFTTDQRELLLTNDNNTQKFFPLDAVIHQQFEAQVTATPEATAIIFEGQSLTYAALNSRANQVAHYLIEQGVGADTLVGIYMDRSIDMVVSILAIVKAGGAYVPLDPDAPESRLRYQVEDAQLTIVLAQTSISSSLSIIEPISVCIDSVAIKQGLSRYSKKNPTLKETNVDSKNLAYVIYTSGSTGQPKGVMVEHQALVNRIEWMQNTYGLTAADKVLQKTPFTFDVSIWEFFWPLTQGAQLVIAKPGGHKEPEYLLRTIQQQGITLLHFVPSMLRIILSTKEWGACSSVTHVFSSGEALPRVLQDQFFASGTTAQLHNLYGPTEAAIDVSSWRCDPTSKYDFVPIGKPIQNIELHVLNKHLQVVPTGVIGELHIGGVGLARGYLHNTELSTEKFISNPFATPADRLYKTGDVVRRLADGNIEYIGRSDHQVKIRGFRVELGEIESIIVKNPMINACVVIVDDNATNPRLVAYIEPMAGTEPSIDNIRRDLKVFLPDYMQPSIFISLQSLPLSANGKINRKALPAPDSTTPTSIAYVAPIGHTEEVLATIWQELLGVDKVGRDDSFFNLGGHSLLVIQLIAQLQHHLPQSHIEARALFATPVLQDMANAIDADMNQRFIAPANLIADDATTITPDLLPLVNLEQSHIDSISELVPGGVENIQDIYALAPLQEGILFHHMLSNSEQGDTYIMPTLLEISGQQNVDTFIKAITTLIQRHDVLRTAIFWQGLPCPVQVVLRTVDPDIHYLDLDASLDIQQQLSERMQANHLWMDITQAPLIKIDIAHEPGSETYFLIVKEHHIINDHIGLDVLLEELNLYLHDDNPSLPTPIPYREFIAHTQALSARGDSEAYFRSRLHDMDEPTLPFGLQDTQVAADNIIESNAFITPEIVNAIREHCQRLQVSTASFFHLAWSVVLGRCTGLDKVVFGSVLSGRLQGTHGADRMLGLFINTLPIRLSLSESVEQSVINTHHELLSLINHEQTSLNVVRQCTGLSSEAPLFTSLFNYRHNQASDPQDIDDVDSVPLFTVKGTHEQTNYPISIAVDESDLQGFELSVQVINSIDPTMLITYMLTVVSQLVTALQSEPAQLLSTLTVLPEDEQKKLTHTLNDTVVDFPQQDVIQQAFEKQVSATPNATALVFQGQSLTYRELNRRANQVAHYLIAQGVGPDSLVGICMERSIDMVVSILAIVKAGGAYVPLDIHAPKARLAYQVNDAKLDIVLTQAVLLTTLADVIKCTVCVDTKATKQILSTYSTRNPAIKKRGLTSTNLAYVIYTSGSTGQPKGVMVEHQALVNRIDWMQNEYALQATDKILQKTPFTFDVSVWEFFWPLSQGAQLIIAKPEGHKDPEYLRDIICQHGITMLHFVPSMLRVMMSSIDWSTCDSVTNVFSSGEALPITLQEHFFATGSSATLHNLYGPTEAAIDVSYWACTPESHHDFVPIGKPIQNTELHVLDKHLQVVPIGVTGELHIGGVGLARGYLNNNELSTEKFIVNPLETKSCRLYKTGDLVRRLVDGNLEYIGRVDHQVKIRGLRVELGEIESQLLMLPAIKDAIVTLDSTDRLVAYIVPSNNSMATTELLIERLRESLPDYMIPAAFITLDAIPLTANGKVNRKLLPALDLNELKNESYQAPESRTEKIVAQLWQTLLDLESVGRLDNFFTLGGHSLLVIRLIAGLQEQGMHTSINAVFETPILKDMAKRIEQDPCKLFTAPANLIPVECTQITPELLPLVELEQQHINLIAEQIPGGMGNIQDIYPLAPLQEGILFQHIVTSPAQGDTYIMPTLLCVKNKAEVDKFLQALQTVINRHDVLRSAVLNDGLPQAVQVVVKRAQVDVTELSLDYSVDLMQQLKDRVAPGKQTMDLTKAPLIQVEIANDVTSDSYYLIINMHHIINDHIGLEVLFDELVSCMNNADSDLPIPMQYREFVAHTLLANDSDAMSDYFKTRYADMDEPTLPFAISDIQIAVSDIEEATIPLTKELTDNIRALSLTYDVSSASIFHLAWSLVIARCSQRDDIVFGTVLSGRLQGTIGAESAMGLFINTLPLRVSLTGSTQELLINLHQELIELISYEHTPLAKIREYTKLATDAPIFTNLFNYRYKQLSVQKENIDNNVIAENEQTVVDVDEGFERTNYPISVSVDDNGAEGFELTAQCINTLNPHDLVKYLQCAVSSIVKTLEESPETPLLSLNIIPQQEHTALLVDMNKTERPQSSFLINEWFEQKVVKHPNALAAIYENKSLSFQQLNERANQVAHELIQQKVIPGSLVGIYMQRSLELVISVLAILKAGAAYVPLDPDYPDERLQYIIDDAGIELVLIDSTQALHATPFIFKQTLCVNEHDIQAQVKHNPTRYQTGANNQDLAYVIYTSGSTGNPKGVEIIHAGVVNYLSHAVEHYLSEVSAAVVSTALSFDATVTSLLAPLMAGRYLHLLPSGREISAIKTLLLDSNEALLFKLTPAHLQLLQADWDDHRSVTTLPHLFVIGGEQLNVTLVEYWKQSLVPNGTFINEYGPTETVVGCSTYTVDADTKGTAVPIGNAIHNTQLYVVDQHLQLVPKGVIGELLIGGAGLARGYLHQPELTKEKFINNPLLEDDSCVYRTGDLVRYQQDGYLEFIGRIDHQVKLRGFRIELSEIEAVLIAQPSINEAAVILRNPNQTNATLVAYISCYQQTDSRIEDLRETLTRVLPGYMIPADFQVMDALPLTVNGKIDRKKLLNTNMSTYQQPYQAPIGALEIIVADTCQELLDIEKMGRFDNFFEKGGNSINALRLIAALKALGYQLSLAHLLESETIAKIAMNIQTDLQAVKNVVLLNNHHDDKTPPLFLIHEVSGHVFSYKPLAKLLQQECPVYGVQLANIDIPIEQLSVKRLATEYIKLIKDVQHKGPYRLAGWSSGGTLAYEIAYQLLSMDEQVAFLGLIDTGRQLHSENTINEFNIIEDLRSQLANSKELTFDISPLQHYIDNNTDIPVLAPSKIETMMADRSVTELFDQLHDNGFDRDTIIEQLNTYHALILACNRYCSPELPIDVHLFTADNQDLNFDDIVIQEWQTLLKDKIKVTEVGGSHETIIMQPTVSLLAQAMSQAMHDNLSEKITKFIPYSPLVELQKGVPTESPLFCIPGAGDSATTFLGLARTIATDVSIIAIQPKGLDSLTVPHTSVEQAASFYIDAIKEEYPVGPYRFVGHSFGGWVAHEMVRQLINSGDSVEFLMMIDSQYPEQSNAKAQSENRIDHIVGLITVLEQNHDKSFAINRDDLLSLNEDEQLALITHKMDSKIDVNTMRSIVNAFITNSETEYHQLSTFHGPCVLFSALQRDEGHNLSIDDIHTAWRKSLPTLEQVVLDGNHMSILKPPLIHQIGEKLTEMLRLKADNNHSLRL